MKNDYNTIFWGLFFSIFHVTIGQLQLLPSFIGILIAAYGIRRLSENFTSAYFRKAYHLAWITAFISFIILLLDLNNISGEIASFCPVIYAGCEMLLIYYLLQGSIEYLYFADKASLAGEYEEHLKIYLILYTVFTVIECIAQTLPNSSLLGFAAVFGLILLIWLLFMINSLKNTAANINTEPSN